MNAIPSIEYLSRAAVRLTRLNQLMNDVAAGGPRHEPAVAATRHELAALNEDIDRYLHLTTLPGEGDFWAELSSKVNRAVELVDATLETAPRTDPTPAAAEVDDALDSAVAAVLTTLEFDVRQSEAMARDVGRLRATTLRSVVQLDALATAIALVTVVFAFRATRRHDQLKDELNAVLTSRVTELDRFAGRVAHDVLSPLSAVTAGLALLGRSCDDERGRTYINRSQRAVRDVQQLVEDLLTFARSGARPDPNATCDLDTVLEGILSNCCDAAAEQGIEVVVQRAAPMHLRCAPGVIASIVQNLLRNAIKYMGDRPARRITIRASVVGDIARVEVHDTGPGVPPEIQSTLFEAFVRGPNEQASGTGLGLATVKRLVESHGGRVGVRSTLGEGSCFWLELPAVPNDAAQPAASLATAEISGNR